MTLRIGNAIGALIFCTALVAGEGSPLDARDLWIREPVPVAKVAAGYGVFRNRTDKPQTLSGADSDIFTRVEIHRTVIEGDAVRMTAVNTVTFGPGETLVFEPNGYHFMLMGPRQPLRAGQTVPVTLHFVQGPEQTVEFDVRVLMTPAHHYPD